VAADANDTNETLLAGPYARDAYDDSFIANWAPDGSSVIFMANQGIWQVNADGTGLHELFEAPAEARGVPIHLHRVYSPASYAGAMLVAAGIVPPLYRWPRFPRSVLASWMGALHGGENLVGLLAPPDVPLPVTIVDFTGGYIAAEASIGAWRFFVADRVRVLPGHEIDPGRRVRTSACLGFIGSGPRSAHARGSAPPSPSCV
jgi:hypothetical protein